MDAENTTRSNSPGDDRSGTESPLLRGKTEIMNINDNLSKVKTKNSSDSEKIDFDTILNYIGQMGLWQYLLLSVVMYAEYTSSLVNLEVSC